MLFYAIVQNIDCSVKHRQSLDVQAFISIFHTDISCISTDRSLFAFCRPRLKPRLNLRHYHDTTSLNVRYERTISYENRTRSYPSTTRERIIYDTIQYAGIRRASS